MADDQGVAEPEPAPAIEPASGDRDEPTVGTRIDRYQLTRRLGAGGMGVVFAARDTELGREVALKLVLVRAGEVDLAAMQARMRREAQAMARLSHPNVVPVFDIGAADDRLFVAMELCEGGTLRSWTQTPRPWRDVVRAFVAAGRGLAAAHAAGIVHRDVKPDNMLLGGGFVRVSDFGLARAPIDDAAITARGGGGGATGDAAITTTGIAGTPAYMAPEQLLGRDVGTAADQFGLCVALFEALHGTRPFAAAGDVPTTLGLLAEITAGRVRPAVRPVPRWLQAAVVRGLAADPARRWPSLSALIAVLERGLGRTRRRAIGAVALVALGAAGFALWPRAPAAACPDPALALRGVWDAARRDALAPRFARHPAWGVAVRRFDTYAAALTDLRREVCTTQRAGRVSARAASLQDRCLDAAQRDLAAAIAWIAARPDHDLAGALSRISILRPLAHCADAGLVVRMAPTSDAMQRQVDALTSALDTLAEMNAGGHTREAESAAYAVVAAARAIDHPASLAHALVLLGDAQSANGAPADAEATLVAALALADRDGLWPSAQNAHLRLVETLEHQPGRYADALRHAELALASAQSHGDARTAAGAATYRARTLASVGRDDEALVAHREALALAESASEAERRRAEADFALTLKKLGRLDEAEVHERAALAYLEVELGPDHPEVAAAVGNLAITALYRGDHATARTLIRRTIGIFERAQPAHVPHALNILGVIELGAGDLDAARAAFERGLALVDAGELELRIELMSNLSGVHRKQGDVDKTIALNREAIALLEARLGPEDPSLRQPLINLAQILREKQQPDEALRLVERARRIAERLHDDSEWANIDQTRGFALFDLARYREAIAPLEACQLRFRRDGDRRSEASCAALLSRALWLGRRDGAGAAAFIAEARDAADAAGVAAGDPLRTEIDDWSAELTRARRAGH